MPWSEVDLSGLQGDILKEQRRQLLAADRGRRFVMSEGPLLRFCLVRLSPARHLLLFTNHHVLMDGWSLPVLLGDIFALYRSRGSTRENG